MDYALLITENYGLREIIPFSQAGIPDIQVTADISAISDFLTNESCILVLLDMEFIFSRRLTLANTIIEKNPHIPLVILSRQINSFYVVSMLRTGAADFIEYPCSTRIFCNRLISVLHRHRIFRKIPGPAEGFEKLIGQSGRIKDIKKLLACYSTAAHPVLILGESGTGKNLVSSLIHEKSDRKNRPYSTVNIAAVPETLAESELFGTTEGAYTGAVSRPGFFEQADGGTLFMDEIGEMSLLLQAKILRSIETGHIRRLGAQREKKVNLRLILATNRNLQERVQQRLFREDLFYRISVLVLEMPSLRNIQDDIPLIANSLIDSGKYQLTLSTMDKILSYRWPGNVRELKNCLTRACVLSPDGIIRPEHIQFIGIPLP
ncbi:MAG: sigma-54 dependent transcriptional regulator [Spirochaetaceae bacterium]|jgi:DNA-binding NtrC family response regulator|nr:sigma-54 dependent transcriptional regulator [Spirochaetaceae bacterium]